MQQEGFLSAPRSSPVGIGVVVTLHAVALTALLLAKPEYIPIKIFTPLKIENIKDTPPPPPNPPERVAAKAKSTVTMPIRVLDSPVVTLVDIPSVDLPVVPTVDLAIGMDRVPAKAEKPAPILAAARLDPRYADALQPAYPPSMARQEIEGSATVRVLIGADGRIKAVEPVAATDPAFHEATAAQALRRWRFKPAMRDGVAVESWQTMTVRFVLER